MSAPGDLFSIMGEDSPPEADAPPSPSTASSPPKKRSKKAVGSVESTPAEPQESTETPGETVAWFSSALPVLENAAAMRARAVEILTLIDPALTERLPAELPFPPEDDPFTKTADEWEAVWYGVRESAHRVYLNMRMEFRKQLARAQAGEPNDLSPWTYWVFNGACPDDGEPVYGLTEQRRVDLGWSYPGPPTDFTIYRGEG